MGATRIHSAVCSEFFTRGQSSSASAGVVMKTER
jgi:hypothetical protein